MNREAVRVFVMEIPSFNKVGMFPAIATGPIVPRFAGDLMLAATLANLHSAVVAVAKGSLLVKETAVGQVILDLVQSIHFL